ncbi:(4S)-4-hydroxy-5-phosphonooxypentane-2,3-dione isomerase [Vibrio sp. VB16]|uniref:(4S)-4-hydroxy-5-phosphonooxypentane-2,3-dione isomerase n=1 Tax=Vibrio sp. VB16 TaxID=2785746 RepID=UPI00189D8F22|nr:(4S)-4-hydroxy-5-phosphonooxypentane-2,3-dione isomerase [Vibrio sp. VB16]UGA57492.1 (4S)-4-hydroxy-5-phosphonooxypentane-2,3-dione isomerase [Vibrio sp. VB16]
MNVTLVEINVKSDQVERFKQVFLPNHLGSLKEEGNVRFDVLQDPKVPTRFIIYEAYRDDEAVLAHKKTPHYLRCVKDLEGIMTGDRTKQEFYGLMIGE